MNLNKIVNLGLSEKETKLYLAALQLGTASITQLSLKAKIKRPTAYLVIAELLKKNLLIPIPKGKNIHYQASDPINLDKEIERKKIALSKLLPELNNLYRSNYKPSKIKDYNQKKTKSSSNKRNIFSVNNLLKAFTKKR
jgi:sugar-specific transcriptional regulator TrmB